jgi:hypothetical protein
MSSRSASEKTLYEEEQPTQRWVMIVAWVGTCLGGAVIVATFFIPGIPSFILFISIAVLLFVLLSVWNFRRLQIRATPEGITFGFGIFRRHLRWRDVVRVSARPYIFLRFLGWGIRLDLRGTIGFIARTSMGVQLETPRLKYFISTNNPQAICDLAQRFIVSGKQRV